MPQVERRAAAPPIITTRNDGPTTIQGVAPVYYRAGDPSTEFSLSEGVVERVRPGAASGAIGADVRSFFNHDPSRILGRTTAGTLHLQETEEGLVYRVDMPETTSGRDALESIRRGDVSGSSFMFRVVRQTWETEERARGKIDVRWIEEAEILEVGPVTFPAYEGSSAEETDRQKFGGEVRSSYEEWKVATEERPSLDLYQRRLVLVDLRVVHSRCGSWSCVSCGPWNRRE